MTAHQSFDTGGMTRTARLFVLDLGGGRILSMNPDGSDKRIIISGAFDPDGIAIDTNAGHIYWTNMGIPGRNDGSIERANLDGSNRTVIVPPGATFTPKQLLFERSGRKLYWSDREGMRVMRCDLDGSHIETLIQTGFGDEERLDQTNWCVGIAFDPNWDEIYWTQKGPDNGDVGRLFRAPVALRAGETPANRTDIDLILDRLPEPIDIEIANGWIYWTDRGDPPRGNSVSRMNLEALEHDPGPPEIVFTHLMEGIGIALDVANDRMFMTDLGGSIYTCRLNGSDRKVIAYAQGNLAGIAYALVPTHSLEKSYHEQQDH